MKGRIAFLFLGDFNFDARATNMAYSLIDNGFAVDVFDVGRSTETDSEFLNITNISFSSCGFLRYFEWFFVITKKIKLFPYFAVIALDLYSLPSACTVKNYKLIYDARDIFTELYVFNRFSIKRIFWIFVESFYIKHVDKVLVTAPSDKTYIQKKYNKFSHIKYCVVFNFPKLYSALDSQYVFRQLKINKNYKIVLYQGVLQKGRGIEHLIKIIKKTKNSIGLIVGDGPYKNSLKKQSSDCSKNIFFINKVPYKQLLNITVSADVGCALIVPRGINNSFCLPNKLFEYVACGVPVLVSNIPNMTHYVKKYNLGVVVKDLHNNSVLISAYNKIITLKKKKVCYHSSLLWAACEKPFLDFIKK